MEILKWIRIMFAAGFIGYFGRYLAMLIKRPRKKQSPQARSREASKKILNRMNRKVAASQIEFEREKARIETRIARKAREK